MSDDDIPMMTAEEQEAIDTLTATLSAALAGHPMEIVMCAVADIASMAMCQITEDRFEYVLGTFTQNVRDLMPINRNLLEEKLADLRRRKQ